ncbi:pentatricopeptide repeat-containing protein-like [Iris pallida]|uniref:Pentatricopeptide repeat-containing protein-like n=1 Tax=Iris pallida TaxID=29817 RepID=A0AAX6F0I6_IRIPA|nr:pentatricopeptide repeat-containing protein-like [Iris pallida]KAJ6845379.1 pentatricopeptide repeat-containing protein-like [Iris pallida]
MLRPKQIGTLSQCARTFYLSGPRCGSVDGTSCTCSEDDTRVQGRQSNRTDSILKQKKLNAASGAAAKVSSFRSKDASGSRSHLKSESQAYTVSAPNVPSPASTLSSVSGKISSIREDVQAPHGSLVNSSSTSTEHFVRTGAATVGMFSGLMNHRIPATNGQAFLTPQTVMVDATHPITTTKSSSGKSRRQDSVQTSPAVSTEDRYTSSSTSDQSGPATGIAQTVTVRAKQSIPGDSERGHRVPSNPQGQRQSNPQKAKFHSGSFVSDTSSRVKVSERKVTAQSGDDIKPVNKFQNPMRPTRFQAGGSLPVNRSVNSVRTVELYYHTLQQLKWGPSAEETLNNLHCRLDAYQANQVLKLLRDHSVALGFFKWLKHQPMFKHDDHTYTTMIGILGQSRQFGTIKRLLDDMKREGCHPTVVTYNRLIHSFGRANYIGEAVEVFNEMQELGYEPDRVTYCTLIDIHAKAGFLDVALDLYQKMQEVGLSPDTFTYSAMVNCLGKAGHLPAADKLFCEMIERGCVPNLVTYNIMIALQAKARNYPSAVKLYRDMQAAGFRPDKITYNIVMEVLGHCGRLDEAEAVFQEMQQDWVPDEPVYGLLVDLWGKAGNVDKARAWFTSMLDAGLRPNVPTCNSLLSAFLRMQRFSDAHDVIENMLGMGLVPSLQTYTLLLSCCTETRSQMGVCCELMAVTGHPAHYFLVSLPDAEPGGQNVRDHASRFMELMHTEDRESKRGLLDAVIDFLHKSGLKEEAGFVWEVAAQRDVYPESVREKSSSYWLINLHVMSEGTAVTALSRTLAWFQRQMLESGTGPRRIDIITGWGRRSRVTGSSLVRQSVQELLHLFGFPFFTENGNSGCFVGCGEPLNRWLLNSYVERMHLV